MLDILADIFMFHSLFHSCLRPFNNDNQRKYKCQRWHIQGAWWQWTLHVQCLCACADAHSIDSPTEPSENADAPVIIIDDSSLCKLLLLSILQFSLHVLWLQGIKSAIIFHTQRLWRWRARFQSRLLRPAKCLAPLARMLGFLRQPHLRGQSFTPSTHRHLVVLFT